MAQAARFRPIHPRAPRARPALLFQQCLTRGATTLARLRPPTTREAAKARGAVLGIRGLDSPPTRGIRGGIVTKVGISRNNIPARASSLGDPVRGHIRTLVAQDAPLSMVLGTDPGGMSTAIHGEATTRTTTTTFHQPRHTVQHLPTHNLLNPPCLHGRHTPLT